MRECRVIVMGELMLDEYLWGEITRISPEAPVPVMHLRRSDRVLGGAANVARNAESLNARVSALGVMGNDAVGSALRAELDSLGVEHEGILIASARPTTRKTRLMSIEHNQQVFRFDEESITEIPPSQENLKRYAGIAIQDSCLFARANGGRTA